MNVYLVAARNLHYGSHHECFGSQFWGDRRESSKRSPLQVPN